MDILQRIANYDSSNGGHSDAAQGTAYELMEDAAGEIKHLRSILQQMADNQLSDENCASVEVAAKRIRGLARAALQGRD